VPRTHTVIDMGTQKDVFVQPKTGRTSLEQAWISRSSAKQRAGRTGRNTPPTAEFGCRVYRLYTRSFHDVAMLPHAPSALQHFVPEALVLRLKQHAVHHNSFVLRQKALLEKVANLGVDKPSLAGAASAAATSSGSHGADHGALTPSPLQTALALMLNHSVARAAPRHLRLPTAMSMLPGDLAEGELDAMRAKVEVACANLYAAGMLTAATDAASLLSAKGRLAAQLPCNANSGGFVAAGLQLGLVAQGVLLAAFNETIATGRGLRHFVPRDASAKQHLALAFRRMIGRWMLGYERRDVLEAAVASVAPHGGTAGGTGLSTALETADELGGMTADGVAVHEKPPAPGGTAATGVEDDEDGFGSFGDSDSGNVRAAIRGGAAPAAGGNADASDNHAWSDHVVGLRAFVLWMGLMRNHHRNIANKVMRGLGFNDVFFPAMQQTALSIAVRLQSAIPATETCRGLKTLLRPLTNQRTAAGTSTGAETLGLELLAGPEEIRVLAYAALRHQMLRGECRINRGMLSDAARQLPDPNHVGGTHPGGRSSRAESPAFASSLLCASLVEAPVTWSLSSELLHGVTHTGFCAGAGRRDEPPLLRGLRGAAAIGAEGNAYRSVPAAAACSAADSCAVFVQQQPAAAATDFVVRHLQYSQNFRPRSCFDQVPLTQPPAQVAGAGLAAPVEARGAPTRGGMPTTVPISTPTQSTEALGAAAAATAVASAPTAAPGCWERGWSQLLKSASSDALYRLQQYPAPHGACSQLRGGGRLRLHWQLQELLRFPMVATRGREPIQGVAARIAAAPPIFIFAMLEACSNRASGGRLRLENRSVPLAAVPSGAASTAETVAQDPAASLTAEMGIVATEDAATTAARTATAASAAAQAPEMMSAVAAAIAPAATVVLLEPAAMQRSWGGTYVTLAKGVWQQGASLRSWDTLDCASLGHTDAARCRLRAVPRIGLADAGAAASSTIASARVPAKYVIQDAIELATNSFRAPRGQLEEPAAGGVVNAAEGSTPAVVPDAGALPASPAFHQAAGAAASQPTGCIGDSLLTLLSEDARSRLHASCQPQGGESSRPPAPTLRHLLPVETPLVEGEVADVAFRSPFFTTWSTKAISSCAGTGAVQGQVMRVWPAEAAYLHLRPLPDAGVFAGRTPADESVTRFSAVAGALVGTANGSLQADAVTLLWSSPGERALATLALHEGPFRVHLQLLLPQLATGISPLLVAPPATRGRPVKVRAADVRLTSMVLVPVSELVELDTTVGVAEPTMAASSAASCETEFDGLDISLGQLLAVLHLRASIHASALLAVSQTHAGFPASISTAAGTSNFARPDNTGAGHLGVGRSPAAAPAPTPAARLAQVLLGFDAAADYAPLRDSLRSTQLTYSPQAATDGAAAALTGGLARDTAPDVVRVSATLPHQMLTLQLGPGGRSEPGAGTHSRVPATVDEPAVFAVLQALGFQAKSGCNFVQPTLRSSLLGAALPAPATAAVAPAAPVAPASNQMRFFIDRRRRTPGGGAGGAASR